MECGAKKSNGEICRNAVKAKGEKCRFHKGRKAPRKKKPRPATAVYSKGTNLRSVYGHRLQTDSKIGEYIAIFEKEVAERGKTFSETLDEEVTLMRALIMDGLNTYEALRADMDEQLGRRDANGKALLTMAEKYSAEFNVQERIVSQLEKLGKTMEKNHKVKYGEHNSIPIEKVKEAFGIFQEILIRNVREPEVLRKILGDMQRTLGINRPNEKQIQGAKNG